MKKRNQPQIAVPEGEVSRQATDSLGGYIYQIEHGVLSWIRSDRPAEEYRKNIQIGELNALDACFAVIMYKQIKGFFFSEGLLYHLLFGVDDCKIAARSIESLNEA